MAWKETHMLARDEDILKAAEDWRKQGRGVALATVVETWGSAPRPVGSNLVIDQEGNFLGSVSGGCVEGAVRSEEHTSELQSLRHLVCRLLLEKKKQKKKKEKLRYKRRKNCSAGNRHSRGARCSVP